MASVDASRAFIVTSSKTVHFKIATNLERGLRLPLNDQLRRTHHTK